MTDWSKSPHEVIRNNAQAISQVEEIMLELGTFEAKSCLEALQDGDIENACYWAGIAEEYATSTEDEASEESANWVVTELNDNLKE